MKIGIISLYRTLVLDGNYGTLFQNWALQSYLNRRGHESFWVRTSFYKPRKISPSKISLWFSSILFHADMFLVRAGIRGINISPSPHARPYQEFLRNYVPISLVEYSADKLFMHPPRVDAFLVGSDQVWGSESPIMYLEFAPPGVRRIAYAASANWKKLPATWSESVDRWLPNFDAVSVREDEGLKLCRKAGRSDAVQVLDPALLPSKEDYLKLIQAEADGKNNIKPSIFSYFVGFDLTHQTTMSKLADFAEHRQLDLKVDVLHQGGKAACAVAPSVINPTPTQWLDAFRSATCVVTNSFHGVVFSIIFERPFLIVFRSDGKSSGNERMRDLLRSLDLERRGISQEAFEGNSSEEIQSLIESDIDWASVRMRLDKLRSTSEAFLESALCSPVAG